MAHVDKALLWHVSLLLAGIIKLEHSKNVDSSTEFCYVCYLQKSCTHRNSKSYLEAADGTQNGVYMDLMSALESVRHGVEATGDRKEAG